MPYLEAGECLKTKHFPYILIHTQRQISPMWISILAMNTKKHSLINLLKPNGYVMHQQV